MHLTETAVTKAQKAMPIVSIIASCAAILLIAVTFHSLRLQIKHTNMQLDKLEKDNEKK